MAPLEDHDQDPIRRSDGQQVQQDRLQRDDDRAEGQEQQEERQRQDEANDERSAVLHQRLRIFDAGRSPVTATSTPRSLPAIGGITSLRSTCSARTEAASPPVPAIANSTRPTVLS